MNHIREFSFSNFNQTESPILPLNEFTTQTSSLNQGGSSEIFQSLKRPKNTSIFNFEASTKTFLDSTNFSHFNENKNGLSTTQSPEIISQFDFLSDNTILSDNFNFDDLRVLSKKQRIDCTSGFTNTAFHEGEKAGNSKTLDDLVKCTSLTNTCNYNFKKKKSKIFFYDSNSFK